MAPVVEYLGHRISAASLQTPEKKIRAIKEAPEPRNMLELWAMGGFFIICQQSSSHFIVSSRHNKNAKMLKKG